MNSAGISSVGKTEYLKLFLFFQQYIGRKIMQSAGKTSADMVFQKIPFHKINSHGYSVGKRSDGVNLHFRHPAVFGNSDPYMPIRHIILRCSIIHQRNICTVFLMKSRQGIKGSVKNKITAGKQYVFPVRSGNIIQNTVQNIQISPHLMSIVAHIRRKHHQTVAFSV